MDRPGVSEARRKALLKEKKERIKNLIIDYKTSVERFRKRGFGQAGKRIKDMSEKDYFVGYKNGGMFGCLLLYPAKDKKGNFFIQNAGGIFDESSNPAHIGSGIDVDTKGVWGKPVSDQGQYDKVREVAWNTFGGLYIKRELLDVVGNFAPEY